ncbi:hypothetical protein [Sulfurimonas sp.]|uniref:hypothetical protein n=1 Tax=Sulfurimonas sp. TaxID=2022749 RepID=UPI003D0BAF30
MKCERCGKEYWTKECMNCKNSYNENDLQNMGIRSSKKAYLHIIITLAVVSIALILGYREYKTYKYEQAIIKYANAMGIEGKDTEELLENSTKMVKEANEKLDKVNKESNEAINKIQKGYMEMDNLLKKRYQEEQTKQQKRYEPTPQPKLERIKPNTTFTPQVPSISNMKPIQQNIPRYTPPKPMKMYPRYSVAKLVSDSKIERMKDNRLKANMPIFGRYTDKPVALIECGKNERVYQIVNECTGTVFPLEKIYFKESNKKSIMNYDKKTHMVECAYNQEHGIMHDCSVKLIGVR